jgi:predicted metalloprotease
MRWRGRRQSSRVEDRRGRMPVGKGVGIGGGGLLLVLLYVLLTGEDPQPVVDVLQQARAGGPSASIPSDAGTGGPISDELGQFASVVLADTEDTWNALFSQAGQTYREPNLVLFSRQVQSACGFASAAVGPFYCPGDGKVYIDLAFFEQLARRFGAPGDFAQAYVIAHEVGHHVQNLLGISDYVRDRQRRLSRADGNEMSIRLELQADCLAGVWGHHQQRRSMLEPGDIEEGMAAASAVGDDNMQRRATGTIQPESWTHGSAEQRQVWFRRGLEGGDPDACDTFAG